ncbi:MAG: hydroxymethylpyrimidine/phosphomethylpyrimidine kinase [Chromatiaceae bacterium]
MYSFDSPPVLLAVGGHDPSGGAGVQADAEAARAAGLHACTVITCLTTQDTCGIRRLMPQPAEQVAEQCRLVLADCGVRAIKVGLLGSSRTVRVITEIAAEHPDLPLVLDPVLASSAGEHITDAALLNQLRKNLLGSCTLVTPNLPEARTLSGVADPDTCGRRLLETGCAWVLVTGTHGDDNDVINRLYGQGGRRREWTWPRLPHEYHGSGCTLASAIAARLAKDMDMEAAVTEAQEYTWETLQSAVRTGRCQLTPNRLYALDPPETSAP